MVTRKNGRIPKIRHFCAKEIFNVQENSENVTIQCFQYIENFILKRFFGEMSVSDENVS